MYVNTNLISAIAEVGQKSALSDGLGCDVIKKKAAIYFEDNSPMAVDETLEELIEAIKKQ